MSGDEIVNNVIPQNPELIPVGLPKSQQIVDEQMKDVVGVRLAGCRGYGGGSTGRS